MIWLSDKGKNTNTKEEYVDDLLNVVAQHMQGEVKPRLLTPKEVSLNNESIEEKLKSLKPPLFRVECPLANLMGFPIAVFAYAEAKPGEPPSKGEPNMIASLLTRRLREKNSRTIRGKALVALTEPFPPLGMDLPMQLLVKLLFFTGDLIKDTIGHIYGEELEEKLKNTMLFFHFFGPQRKVIKQMTVLRCQQQDPRLPPQDISLEELKEQHKHQQEQNQYAQRNSNMPIFMQLPYMQDKAFRNELKHVVLRGWSPPTSVGGGDSTEDVVSSGSLREPATKSTDTRDNNHSNDDSETNDSDAGGLDFSDLYALKQQT